MKVEMDKLFGYVNFRNEIVWKRTSAHSSAHRFGPIHDVILFYSRSDSYLWNGISLPHDRAYIKKFFRGVEPNTGRGFHANVLTGAGIRHGESGRPWRGYDPTKHGRHWALPHKMLDQLRVTGGSLHEKLDALDAGGRVFWPNKLGGQPRLKYYADELKGAAAGDIWTDIPPVSGKTAERLGYPTQKPLALLERIISASSNKGDVVLDAYCGCGTTMEAAQNLGRRWIGIDISQTAMRVVENRVRKIGAALTQVHGMVETEADLRSMDWREFQTWAVDAVQGRHSPRKVADMGIDGFTFMENHPIQVKQIQGVGRPTVDSFVGMLERQKDKRGIIIAFDFTKGAHAEVARLKREAKIDIQLIPCKRLIREEIPFREMA
jgi:site-specific DNA-methyltransferase (adenine-specific)